MLMLLKNDTKQIFGQHMHIISERINNEIVSWVLAATRSLPTETQSRTNSCYSVQCSNKAIFLRYRSQENLGYHMINKRLQPPKILNDRYQIDRTKCGANNTLPGPLLQFRGSKVSMLWAAWVSWLVSWTFPLRKINIETGRCLSY